MSAPSVISPPTDMTGALPFRLTDFASYVAYCACVTYAFITNLIRQRNSKPIVVKIRKMNFEAASFLASKKNPFFLLRIWTRRNTTSYGSADQTFTDVAHRVITTRVPQGIYWCVLQKCLELGTKLPGKKTRAVYHNTNVKYRYLVVYDEANECQDRSILCLYISRRDKRVKNMYITCIVTLCPPCAYVVFKYLYLSVARLVLRQRLVT